MMKVYDMVTYSLCAPTDNVPGDAPDQATANTRHAELPQAELGLQLIEATPAQPETELHPALCYTDVASFLAALDN